MELTKREKRKLRLRQQTQKAQEEQKPQHKIQLPQPKSQKQKYYFIAALIAMFAIAAYSIYSLNKPGPYDNFAKCLSEKNAVMYGAMDWCKYTQAQKSMFGKSFKYINYHDYKELPGISKTPTWVIDGTWYENAQSLDKLASLTGCKL